MPPGHRGAAANPTTANTCASSASGGTGAYSVDVTNLTAGKSYHVRAYAINSVGTAYGADVPFTTSTGKGPFAYITNSNANTVSVIDTQTNLIYGNPIAAGKMPVGVAVNATGTRVFVANLTGNTVSTIDTSTDTVTGSPVAVGYLPFAVALNPVNTMVYTADYITEDMGYFDSAQSAPKYNGVPMGIGTHPDAVAVSPDGSRVYVADSGLNNVAVVDANTHTIIGSAIPVGSGPDALGLSPDGTRLYVANGNENTLTLIDTTTNSVIGPPITVGNAPGAITFNLAGTLAYVTNYSDNSVSVVDTSTNLAVGNPILVGNGPWGIAMHPTGTFLYVVNNGDDSVSVIDTATLQITATVLVGSQLAGFGQFILPPLSVVSAVSANITGSAATSVGNVTADGGSAVTARGVCWGLAAKPALGGTCKNDTATGTGVFSLNLTGLVALTGYHLRAFATNAYGTAYGADVQFTTGPAAIPTLTTASVTAITATSATSGGNITDDGGAQVTARGVCWGTNPNPTTSASCTHDGAGTGTFTSSLTGLTANTPYHVRAYATNSVGTSYGADVQFTTSSAFRIWACSNSLTVKAGGMIICEISLASVGGFTGSVALSSGGLPPHSTCLIYPKSFWLKPSGIEHSIATIATSRSTTKGTYTLTFTGTTGSCTPGKGGSGRNSTSVTLIVK